MQSVDLNLLLALDVLLSERSVTKAARRLRLSPSAMSRTLARLRKSTGDPLLVQAGRTLTPTPYAESLVERVHTLARDTQAVLQPSVVSLDLSTLDRTFVLRASEGFVQALAGPLVMAAIKHAPKVRFHFVPKPDKDAQPLRDGLIDLEVGVFGTTAPELRQQLLFRDRFVGVCRADHPLLKEEVTAERYAACRHVVVTRKGITAGPVDVALQQRGLHREVTLTVPSHPEAVWIARNSDLVALVPRTCLGNAIIGDYTTDLGVTAFTLPVQTEEISVCAIWHPRLEVDPAHRWLRETLSAVCRTAYPTKRGSDEE
ncbi:LysR family transcriptional regulator [Neorhizobium sp. JUb45]|uniref:LysR family transcriptional regulator n=1 Tax=unclassified Neorhizobium TaxID=2629175 RepID=UPI0010445213|nr:LysR family transcriptional regulator [Neorhizobium sp. JUb45]